MSDLSPEERAEERRRRAALWLDRGLAGLRVGGVLLFLSSPAWADNPIERLQSGDFQGFTEDAMRTDWVMALTAGTGAAFLGPGIASALQRLQTEGGRLEELEKKWHECQEEVANLQKKYDQEKERLDFVDGKLREASRAMFVYSALNTACDGVAVLWVVYGAAAAYVAVSSWLGATAATTGAAGGAGAAEAGRRLTVEASQAQARLAGARAAVNQALMQLRAAGSSAMQVARRVELKRHLVAYKAALRKHLAAQKALNQFLARAGAALNEAAKTAAQSGKAALGAGFTTLYAVGEAARSTGLSALEGLKNSLKYGKGEEFRRQYDALSRQLDEQRKAHRQLRQKLNAQKDHCRKLRAAMDAQAAQLKSTLTGAKRQLDEAKIRGSTQDEIIEAVRHRAEGAGGTSPPPPPPPGEGR